MQVLSRCPLRVGSILWLPRAGAYALTVVCKATFRLAPDVSPLAGEQEPVTEADTYPEHDDTRGLALASDLVPFKRRPEVLLVGHAYAPQGGYVGRLVARLTIMEVDKAIEITGDRHFKLDGSLSHPARFTKMPLCWERAAGGPETSNPIGVPTGPEVRPDSWGRVPVPNLVPLDRLIADRDDVVPPACFAPMAPHWPARLARLHRYGPGFPHHAWHARPLPPDFDPGYFNAAPPDQQVHEILGNERFTLENLHPQYPLLTTQLEGVRPRAHVDWGTGGPAFEIPLACDTLLIDTDRGIACVTFRGSIALDYPERAGWVVVTMDGHHAAPAREAHPSRPPAREAHPSRPAPPEPPPREVQPREPQPARGGALPAWMGTVKEVNETVAFDGDEQPAAGLPFGDGGAEMAFEQTGDLDDAETFASEHAGVAQRGRVPGVPVVQGGAAGPAPVPPEVPKGPRLGAFRLASPSESPPAPARAPALAEGAAGIEDPPTMDPEEMWLHETADDPLTARRPGVPVPPLPGAPLPPIGAQPAPVPPPPVPARMRSALPFAQAAPVEETLPRPASPEVVPFVARAAAPLVSQPGMTIGEMVAQARVAPVPVAPVPVAPPVEAPPSIESEPTMDGLPVETPPPPPPARIGPLATPEMVAADLGAEAHDGAKPGGQGTAEAAAPADAPVPAEPKPLPLDEYPLERCARIAASIARSRDKAAAILEAHALQAPVWEALKAHWAAEIKKETERGKTALLRAYDAAYVAQLEEERGPIAVEEYARMVVAQERGTAAQTLGEMGLPEGSMLRIQRVWMGKTQKDPELRRLVRSAVESASEA